MQRRHVVLGIFVDEDGDLLGGTLGQHLASFPTTGAP
jgi:hypothetical protein